MRAALLSAVAFAIAPFTVSAQIPLLAISVCKSIKDDGARLKCYDSVIEGMSEEAKKPASKEPEPPPTLVDPKPASDLKPGINKDQEDILRRLPAPAPPR